MSRSITIIGPPPPRDRQIHIGTDSLEVGAPVVLGMGTASGRESCLQSSTSSTRSDDWTGSRSLLCADARTKPRPELIGYARRNVTWLSANPLATLGRGCRSERLTRNNTASCPALRPEHVSTSWVAPASGAIRGERGFTQESGYPCPIPGAAKPKGSDPAGFGLRDCQYEPWHWERSFNTITIVQLQIICSSEDILNSGDFHFAYSTDSTSRGGC